MSDIILQLFTAWLAQRLEKYLDQISAKLEALSDVRDAVTTSYEVLDSLYFPQMKFRQTDIVWAHENTFAWIFDQEVTSFETWLQSPSPDSQSRLFGYMAKQDLASLHS